MQFTPEFVDAFNHSMLFEVGPWWNPNDPEVISGACATKDQRRKVGYVNIKQDRGGLTKYGVALNANPNVDVQNLNLHGAMEIYYNRYWLAGKSNLIPYPAQIMHYDAGVNHGIGRAAKMLQQAVGAVPDGAIGPVTIAKIREMNPETLLRTLNDIRVNRFKGIVRNDPSQAMFLNGWLRRASEVFQYAMSHLQR
jgi:lysozyme family protein